MAKRGRPPDSPVRRDILAAIAQLTVESQPHSKRNDNVEAAAEELVAHAVKHRGWRDLLDMGSARTIYTYLKHFRSKSEK